MWENVISLRGRHGLQHVTIEPINDGDVFNAACHVCANRFRCRKNAVKKMLEEMNPSLIEYHLSKIKANPYNIPLLEMNISDMMKDLNVTASNGTKLCFLGEIMSCYGNIPVLEGRVISNSFCEYLNRRDA